MKVLITGKNGQLGMSIKQIVSSIESKHDFIFIDKNEMDFSDEETISRYFERDSFDAVVNCAAYTAVDKAESEVSLANQINHISVKELATVVKKNNMKLIHISTDAVFDGNSTKPYTENISPNTVNAYGKSKLLGEKSIQKVMSHNAIIIRTSWMYSGYGNNFVKTILELGTSKKQISVVDDQIGSPTYALDLAQAIIHIISHNNFTKAEFKTQIYHYSNSGFCSWYEFTKEIFKLANIECLVNPITTDNYPTPATRPMFTALDSQKIIDDFDLKIPEWEKSIAKYTNYLHEKSSTIV